MARSTSEEEIRLRKRARRRLIGAIVLTTLVVVALPMVLDSEPRPIGDDIAVQIPSPGSSPYAPKGASEATRPGSAPGNTSGAVNVQPAAPVDTPPPSSLPSPSAAAAAAAAAAPAATPAPVRGPTPAASSATPADQKIQVVGALRSPPDAAGAAAGAAAEAKGAAEAAAAARTSAARAAEAKAAEARTIEAAADAAKAAPEARSTPAKGPDPRSGAPKGADAKAVDAKGADARAASGDAEAKNFVIQLGAFAEVNRAKDRHAQLVKAGVKAYTEVIKTPTGDKTRVRAGPFPTREAAEQANERLKGLGLTDGIVVPRRY